MFYNVSMDGSGDDALELIFPTSFSTRAPVEISASTKVPSFTESITNTLTTTMVRLKDFVFSRVVDFLQENLLIIIVVTSVLIVMVFIICCASAMSHKRKLESYKPLSNPPKKYTADKKGGQKNSSDLHERPFAVDHVKRVHSQAMASPKTLRVPSKALVGERGRDVPSSPRQEVRKVRDTEEAERRQEEPRPRDLPREHPRDLPREHPRDLPREHPRDLPRENPRDLPRDYPRDLPRDYPRDLPRDYPRDLPRDNPRDERKYRQDLAYDRASPSSASSQPICTCHLRKAYH
uniref:Transmembrane protein n=1 Tax=Knipowitschia caucasica TaxID=637954 RepID=A0AAV2MRG0_KNICA